MSGPSTQDYDHGGQHIFDIHGLREQLLHQFFFKTVFFKALAAAGFFIIANQIFGLKQQVFELGERE